MPYTPTPSQSKALRRERHLALTANAGSGKTQVLVTKYLDLLEHDPTLHPRNIVAITFSENAASELSDKISRAITERLKRVPKLRASAYVRSWMDIPRPWSRRSMDSRPAS